MVTSENNCWYVDIFNPKDLPGIVDTQKQMISPNGEPLRSRVKIYDETNDCMWPTKWAIVAACGEQYGWERMYLSRATQTRFNKKMNELGYDSDHIQILPYTPGQAALGLALDVLETVDGYLIVRDASSPNGEVCAIPATYCTPWAPKGKCCGIEVLGVDIADVYCKDTDVAAVFDPDFKYPYFGSAFTEEKKETFEKEELTQAVIEKRCTTLFDRISHLKITGMEIFPEDDCFILSFDSFIEGNTVYSVVKVNRTRLGQIATHVTYVKTFPSRDLAVADIQAAKSKEKSKNLDDITF